MLKAVGNFFVNCGTTIQGWFFTWGGGQKVAETAYKAGIQNGVKIGIGATIAAVVVLFILLWNYARKHQEP